MTDSPYRPSSGIRLDYETKAGNLSPEETYKQFLELCRLAEESARLLSVACKARNDLQMAKAWTGFADHFNKIGDVVTELATGKGKTSVGYHGNA